MPNSNDLIREDDLDEEPFILCVDLDGVVADYEAAFAVAVAARKNVDASSIGPQTCWNFAECPNWPIDSQEEFMELHQRAVVERSMFLTMPEIDGASETLWELSNAGVHIRVVTHRLVHHWSHDRVVSDTVRWLQFPRPDGRPRIPYRDLCFVNRKFDVGGDLYVDDAPHNVEALRARGIDTVVMDAGYNRHLDGPRAHTWADVAAIVAERTAM